MSTPYDVYDGPECGGEGGFRGDEVDPDLGHNDFVRCGMCHGDGGWWQCWNSDKHPKQEGGND